MATLPTSLSAEIEAKYTLENNAFKIVAKDSPKDRVEVVVGDDKQPNTFYPQIKIQRWDNEVNTSIRLKDDGLEPETVTTDKDKIIWSKGAKEVHFYDLAVDEKNPEGGYEVEVVLKERPETNVIEFTIQTKDLNFFYQPPLTQEEIDRGDFRPENVVGSYAVYHKTRGGLNDSAGMEYKVGKAFHIYRPKVIDAKGNGIWGELNVDTVSGLLTVTIDNKWLDKAAYPVIVDPTFGYTTASTTGYGYIAVVSGGGVYNNYITGSSFSLSENGSLTSITAFIGVSNLGMDATCKFGIYDSDKVYKGATQSGDTADITFPAGQWVTRNFASALYLPAGTYWIVALGDSTYVGWGTNVRLFYATGAAGQGGQEARATSYTFSDPYNPSTASHKYDIYATYTAGGGGTEVNSSRGAKTAGKATTNNARSAKVVGKSTANNARSAKVTGVVGDVYTREYNASLPTNDNPLSTQYAAQDYTDVGTDDTDYVGVVTVATGYMVHQFEKFNTNENNTDAIIVSVVSRSTLAPSSSTVYLQIYNRDTEEWETLDSDNSTGANTDLTLSGTQSADLSNYYDANYIVALRIYQGVA